MKKFVFAALLLPLLADAQAPRPRDTSFTTYSAYIKARKSQPFIKIANPNITGIDSAMNVTYCRRGDRELKADIFKPSAKSAKRLPAILFIHGGGWSSGNRAQHIPMAKTLAARGFVTVAVEYRLSTEALYPAAPTDIKTAIAWFRDHAKTYHADPEKIAIWGFSAGGQLAALMGTTNGTGLYGGTKKSDVQAVIDVDGTLAFIHPESGEGNDAKGPSAATLWFGAPKSAGIEKWMEASPLTHVSRSTPPFLFINSAVARMHAGRNDMIHKMDSLGIYSEVHELPDTQHTFPLFDPWFATVADYTAAFLQRVFK